MTSTEQASKTDDKPDEQEVAAPAVTAEKDGGVPATKVPADDADSDWEELDDVLDDFDGPKEAAKVSSDAPPDTIKLGDLGDLDEEEFMKQLEADMLANLMGGVNIGNNADKGKTSSTTTDTGSKKASETSESNTGVFNTELEDITNKLKELENGGFDMESVLKDIIGSDATGLGTSNVAGNSAAPGIERGDSFQDTIKRTMERMQQSGDRATAEVNKQEGMENETQGLLNFLKLMDGNTDDVEKIFDNVMKEMSNKDILYEPMKEYNTKYGPWLEENRSKVSPEDLARYETQARLVKEIMDKFEEKDYSDEKPECLAYIWDRMQQIEAVAPFPEDIIENPFPDLPDLKDAPDGQLPPDCTPQ